MYGWDVFGGRHGYVLKQSEGCRVIIVVTSVVVVLVIEVMVVLLVVY